MPAFRNVRRSRRLSHQSPNEGTTWFFDLELQYPTQVNEKPHPEDTPPLDPCSPGHASTSSASSPETPPTPLPLQSQSRRKDGHIPRPPNAFMLYRSAFWAKQKETGCVERDHRQISRIAAHCWNSLNDAERKPYQKRAQQLKAEHGRQHPHYKYSPTSRKVKAPKRAKRDDVDENERCKALATLVMNGVQGSELQLAVTTMDEQFEQKNLIKIEASKTGAEEDDVQLVSHAKPRRRRHSKNSPRVKIELLLTPVPDTNPLEYVPVSEIPPLDESTMSEPLISSETFFKREASLDAQFRDYAIVVKSESKKDDMPAILGPSLIDAYAVTNYYETNGDCHEPIPYAYVPTPDPFTISEPDPKSGWHFSYDASLYTEKHDFSSFELMKMDCEAEIEEKEFAEWINFDPKERVSF